MFLIKVQGFLISCYFVLVMKKIHIISFPFKLKLETHSFNPSFKHYGLRDMLVLVQYSLLNVYESITETQMTRVNRVGKRTIPK